MCRLCHTAQNKFLNCIGFQKLKYMQFLDDDLTGNQKKKHTKRKRIFQPTAISRPKSFHILYYYDRFKCYIKTT